MTAHAVWIAPTRALGLLMVSLLGAHPAWSASTRQLEDFAASPVGRLVAGLVLSLALLGMGLGWWRLRRRRWQTSALDAIESAPWPVITVLLPTQPKDPSFSRGLQALLVSDYPAQCLRVVPISAVDDVQTCAIVNAYAHLFPERVLPCHGKTSAPDKSLAMSSALPLVEGDVLVVLQAAQMPGPGFFKALAKPFFDPEVGLVLGQPTHPQAETLMRRWTRMWHGLFKVSATLPSSGAVRLSALQALGEPGHAYLDNLALLRQPLQAQGWRTLTQRCVLSAAGAAALQGAAAPVVRSATAATDPRSSSATDEALPSATAGPPGPHTRPSSMEHA